MPARMFTVTDPQGNEVSLTSVCWHAHIQVWHPVMAGHLDKIEETVSNPDFIYESKRNRRSRLYFKAYDGLSANNQYVMVVVDSKRGYVQSSFLVQDLSKGGKLIWKKS
jgi:hypothetical protein